MSMYHVFSGGLRDMVGISATMSVGDREAVAV